MPKSKCPGLNPNVLPQVAIGMGLAQAATQPAARAAAKQEAEAKAVASALAQFGNHLCAAPCVSVPIPKLVGSGSGVIADLAGGGSFSAFGWAKAQLDVLCLKVEGAGGGKPPAKPRPPKPRPPSVPGNIAPVTPGSRTR
jgi:hypothetical protein